MLYSSQILNTICYILVVYILLFPSVNHNEGFPSFSNGCSPKISLVSSGRVPLLGPAKGQQTDRKLSTLQTSPAKS